jgi:hypothetical protein
MRGDFEILPRVTGRGRYLGATLGCIADQRAYGNAWWGEGEVKAYIDGDTGLPTLCGTGAEDYIGTGWGQGRYANQWQGCPVADNDNIEYSFYRLHGPDPVMFHHEARITIQQIGCYNPDEMARHMAENRIEALVATGDGTRVITRDDIAAREDFLLFERQDDWCATAYFYLDRPESGLPAIQSYDSRAGGLMGDRP